MEPKLEQGAVAQATRNDGPRRTVAVTGATGFVGRHVVRELHSRGHTVRALARDPETAREALRGLACTTVVGDVFDDRSLSSLMVGADTVIHLIGIRRELGRGVTFQRMHVEATRRVAEAATLAGARRFLHMSALGARPEAPCAYQRTKFEGEQIVRRSGLAWTIFRPSVILGHEGEFLQMAAEWARGEAAPYTFLPYFFSTDPASGEAICGRVQPVAAEDVAWAFVESLGAEQTVGEVYPIGGPEEMAWTTLLEAIHEAVPDAKEKLKPRGISSVFAANLAKAAAALGLAGALPFGPDEPVMGAEDNTCRLEKAAAHFGFSPRSLEEILGVCAAKV